MRERERERGGGGGEREGERERERERQGERERDDDEEWYRKTFACIFTIARRTPRNITHNVISSFLKPRELCNAMIGLSSV